MSMQIVFEQILIIFGYVIVGYVAGKKNLITKEQQRYLSKLVSSLILPFTVLSASSMEASGQDIVKCCHCCGASFSCMALTSLGHAAWQNKQVHEKKVPDTGSAHILNCTFIEFAYCVNGRVGNTYSAAGIIALICYFSRFQILYKAEFHPKIFLTLLNIYFCNCFDVDFFICIFQDRLHICSG